jgi:hypothetical protein
VLSGGLICDACKETISKKKSSAKKHIQSQKHIKLKDVIKKSKKKDQSIRDLMARNTTGSKAKGSTLTEDMRLYRYELVETLLNAGIPLSKADIMRPFLEKYGHRLTSHSHLAEFIPWILQKEKDTVKAEIAANDIFPLFLTAVHG